MLYKEVGQPLQLAVVCNQLSAVHFYEGIVDLCLTLAQKRDPQNLGLHLYKNGAPDEDVQGVNAYIERMECYKIITNTLKYLSEASISHPQAPSVPKSPGPPPTLDPTRLEALEAEQYRSRVFSLALKSDDELFHVALYEWLFSENQTERILEIQSPFMEPYLKQKAASQADAIGALDLLWKYYEKSRNFSAAAKILSRLAERHGTDVHLQQRIEYLSRAIMCAKSSTTRTTTAMEGEFLHELEEKMEVARLQMQVQRDLSKLHGNMLQVQEALSRLDSDLLDLTTLYEDFADKFGLSECKLAIVHCAGLDDGALVENLWQKIIDQEIENTTSMSPQLREKSLHNRLAPIGKLYVKTERYFPTANLVRILEQKSCELGLSCSWVYQLMLDVGVLSVKLHEIYDQMFKSRDSFWQSRQKPLHLLECICGLLSHLTANSSLIPPYERSRFKVTSLDSVARYLVELHAMQRSDLHPRLERDFKRLQCELNRL